MKRLRNFVRSIVSLGLVVALSVNMFGMPVFADSSCAAGMSKLDCDAINNDWVNWIPNACAGVDTSSTTLVGNGNTDKAFNYFLSKGLTPVTTAAVVGNLYEESHLDPTIVQNPPGGDTLDPVWITPNNNNDKELNPKGVDLGKVGWGIAQWTPGAKVIGIAQSLNITSSISDLATQLDIVWAEMTGISPTGYQNMVDGLKQQPDLPGAVAYFQTHFEGGTNFNARLADAQQVAANHNNNTPSDSSTSAASPADCGIGNVTGVPGTCDSPAPTGGYEAVKAALLTKFKVILYGDTNADWATQTYNTMCALAKSPTYFAKLTAQGTINIAFHGGDCGSGHTGDNSGDGYNDPYGVAIFGFCHPPFNRFLLTHELGHLYSFRNPGMYQDFLRTVWSTGATLPTFNCLHDYDSRGYRGPYDAECWADMIGEYLVYFDVRDTVGGIPRGSYDFKTYPTQYSVYYNFARDKLFGGVQYTSF